jgi:UDP-glucose 4-epimerase
VTGEARGAFNLATEPLVTREVLADALGVRVLRIHSGLLRKLADLTWKLTMQPTTVGMG